MSDVLALAVGSLLHNPKQPGSCLPREEWQVGDAIKDEAMGQSKRSCSL
jgi:hypothetical protein